MSGVAVVGGVVAVAALTTSHPAPPPAERPSGPGPIPPEIDTDGWVWPLADWGNGRAMDPVRAIISDGPGSARDGGARKHHGADIDFKRRRGEYPQFKIGTREASPSGLYYCPDGVHVVAARAGTIWSSKLSPKGLSVVIDHGKPYATYYQHLRTVRWSDVANGEGAIHVNAGEVIGTVGNGNDPGQAPLHGFNHLHFEIWKGGGPESWVDPTPYLRTARHVAARK